MTFKLQAPPFTPFFKFKCAWYLNLSQEIQFGLFLFFLLSSAWRNWITSEYSQILRTCLVLIHKAYIVILKSLFVEYPCDTWYNKTNWAVRHSPILVFYQHIKFLWSSDLRKLFSQVRFSTFVAYLNPFVFVIAYQGLCVLEEYSLEIANTGMIFLHVCFVVI